MTEQERRLVGALALMAQQYLSTADPGSELDNLCMSAGEAALGMLAEYGLVTITAGGRCGAWTEAGSQFLISN
jgi:hypothetical protein